MKPQSNKHFSVLVLAITVAAVISAYVSESVSANFFFFARSTSALVTRTWDGGGATNNWSEGANWSGDVAPVPGDDVVFDGTSTKNSVVDINFSIKNLNINTGYTGMVSLGSGVTLNLLDPTQSSQADGIFNCSNGTFLVSPSANPVDARFTMNGGTFNCVNGTFQTTTSLNITLNAGTFEAPSGTMTLTTNFENNFIRQPGAVFNHNNGTVVIQGGPSNNGILIGGPEGSTIEFGNLTINTTGAISAISPSANRRLVVNGTLNLTDGNLNVDVEARGAVNIANTFGQDTPGNLSTGNNKLLITGPARTVTLPTLANQNLLYNRIELNSTGSILNTSGAGPVKLSHLTVGGGTFNVGSTLLSIFGSVTTQANGIFDCNSGNVLFSFANIGIASLTMDGGLFDCENGTFNSDSSVNINLNAGTFEAPSGTMTLTTTFENNFSRQAGAVFNHNNGTVVFQGGPSNTNIFIGGPEGSTFEFGNLTLNTTGVFTPLPPSVNRRLVVNGTLNLTNGDLSVDTEARGAVNIANTFGASTPGNTATGSGKLMITGPPRTVTIPTLTDLSLRYNPIELNSTGSILNASGAGPVRLGHLTLAAGTFNVGTTPVKVLQTVTTQAGSVFNCNSGTVTFSTVGFGLSGLIMNGGLFDCENGTFNSEANIDVTLNAGTFEAPSGTMTVLTTFGTTFLRQAAATFNHNNGTVIFSGNSTIGFDLPPVHEFFNLTIDVQNGSSTFINSGAATDVIRTLGHLKMLSGTVNNGIYEAHGNVTIGTGPVDGFGRLVFAGSNNQTFTNNGGVNPRGTWTINKPTGVVTAASSMILQQANQQLLIQSGRLYLNDNSNLTAGFIGISAPGSLVSDTATTITLGGDLTNLGTIDLNGSGATCPGADTILIRSTNATQRTWQGNGMYRLVDVDVQNMSSPGTRTVFSGTNSGGNSATWVFDGGCPIDLSITPSVAGVPSGDAQIFTAAGGSAPYTFSLPVNNSGATIVPSTGRYTAGPTMGVSDTVRVTDAFGATADATVNVTGVATKLGFIVQPSNTAVGQTVTPSVKVACQDANGNTVTTITPNITIAIGNNPSGGTLSGTLTRQASFGVATFNDLSIDATGNGYTLHATNIGLTTGISSSFNITGGTPTHLAFVVQPSDTIQNSGPMTPPVQVAIKDANGNTVPSASATISLNVPMGNPTGLILSGVLSQQTVNGVATFDQLIVRQPGEGHTIVANAFQLTSATSAPFEIFSEYAVLNTNDSGPGSLRQAIINANNRLGTDTVTFDIPGNGPHTILLQTGLPVIQHTVFINGRSQPGFNQTPIIEVRPANAIGIPSGLVVSNGQSTIIGLALSGFTNAIELTNGDQNLVRGNFIGTNTAGTGAMPNATGIRIRPSSSNNVIGGSTTADRNLISGNVTGVLVAGANNTVRGNYIGTDAAGNVAVPNSTFGILIFGDSNTVRNNVVSGNTLSGIGISTFSAGTDNVIQNNLVGLTADGTASLGNGEAGILVQGPGPRRNKLTGNRVFGNVGNGIKLNPFIAPPTNTSLLNDPLDGDDGPNELQNSPLVNFASNISGATQVGAVLNSTPSTLHRIEFFSSPSCDASSHGEGETFVGQADIMTDAGGLAQLAPPLVLASPVPNGRFITATATDPDGNTSEFSNCQVVAQRSQILGRVLTSGGVPIPNIQVRLTNPTGPTFSRTTFTNSTGNYSFSFLPPADYTLTASDPNLTFTPASRFYPNLTTNQVEQNFTTGATQTFSIRGQARTNSNGSTFTGDSLLPPVPAGGFPLLGVTFNVTGPGVNRSITNDTFGNYRFDALPPGTYTVVPSKSSYTFNPPAATVTIGNGDQSVDFNGESISLSTLSGRIVYDSRGSVKAMNADGSGVATLSDSSRASTWIHPRYSENGRDIVLVARGTSNSSARIAEMGADGSGRTFLYSSQSSLSTPTISPDGTRIAFQNVSNSLVVMNRDGSNAQSIIGNCADPDWSPDGVSIVCLEDAGGGDTDVKTVNLITRTQATVDSTGGLKFSPRWSPDGTRIAFIRRQAGTPATHSIVVKTLLAGTDVFMSGTHNLNQTLSWSPDSARLLFVRDSVAGVADNILPPGANKQLVTIQANDGQNMLVIVDGFDGTRVDWGVSNSVATPPSPTPTTISTGAVSISFPSTTGSNGFTTVTPIEPSSAGSAPNGFVIGNFAFEITTTAGYTPPVTICIDLDDAGLMRSPQQLVGGPPALMHSENGILVNITTSYNDQTHVVCGQANSFSPFVIAEQIDPALPSIKGLVIDSNGDPMPGVSVDLTGAGTANTTTDSEGLFSFVNLIAGGNYSVKPSKVGTMFTEYSLDMLAVTGESVVVFTGQEVDFDISGQVVDGGGVPVAGQIVTLDGAAALTTLTDGMGNYSFVGLPADGAYYIAPASPTLSYSPLQQVVGALTSDVSGVDFVMFAPTAANVSVGGRVVNSEGQGIGKARITISDIEGNARSALTNAFGYYRFDDIQVSNLYIISVEAKQYVFPDPSRTVYVLDELTDVDFTALPRDD